MSKSQLSNRLMRRGGQRKMIGPMRGCFFLLAFAFFAVALFDSRAFVQTLDCTIQLETIIPCREATLDSSSPLCDGGRCVRWDGEEMTSGGDAFKDYTLLHVNLLPSFWATRTGGVRIRIYDYRPNPLSDFDLHIYKIDEADVQAIREGRFKKEACVAGTDPPECRGLPSEFGSTHTVIGSPENFAIHKPSGYYLIEVRGDGQVNAQYTGEAKLVTHDLLPPEQRQPLGLAFSLPSVSGGARPGPDVLYAPPPNAPQLSVRPPFRAAPLLVSGTEAYVNGEYLYQDYLYDDYGSDTDGNGGGLCGPGAERSGDIEYPTDRARYGGNAADLVEFRLAVAADRVTYRFTLNTLLVPDSTIMVLAFDTDLNNATGQPEGSLPRHPGHTMRGGFSEKQGFPGTEEVITTWGTGAEHSKWTDAGWITTPLSVNTDTEANQITVSVPRHLSDPQGTWRATVAVGLYDKVTGGWLRPQPGPPSETRPGGGNVLDPDPSGIFNLGFRFNEPVTACSIPPDTGQSLAMANNQPTQYARDIDFAKLYARFTSPPALPHGRMQIRIFPSRLKLDPSKHPWEVEGRDLRAFPAYLGQLQPYSLYIPTTYAQGTPAGLTLALHGAQQYHYSLTGRNYIQQVGEQRDNLLAQPLGRGGLNLWRNEGEYDVFEVWNDVAARFTLDRDSATLSGVSMGGLGTYRLGTLYPDLFGAALSIVAPPGEPVWIPPAPPPGAKQPAPPPPLLLTLREGAPETLTNLYLENVRNVPFMNVVFATDELVPFAGTRAQNLGAPEYGIRGFDDHRYRFLFQVSDVALHSFGLPDDYSKATGFLGAARVNRNPARVTFAYVEKADEPDRDPNDPGVTARRLKHNHAYWVSDLASADPNRAPDYGHPPMGQSYPAKGIIDAFSHAFGIASEPNVGVGPALPIQCTPGVQQQGCDPYAVPYTQFERTWGPPLSIPRANRLDIKLSNLGGATIDAERAGLNVCQAISLVITENDSSCRLVLTGPFSAASVTGASFEQTPDGVALLLNPGPATVTIVPICRQPDLQVTKVVASNNHARQGEKVIIDATIANTGSAAAGGSKTETLLDGATIVGLVDTPAIPAGGAVTVSVQWRTASVKGQHTIRVTADKTGLVAESNEANNTGTLTVTVKGNRVTNGSFEQSNASGTGPTGWSSSSTDAGTTSWSATGTDGTRAAAVSGNGGNALLASSPKWTSDAIAVTPGEVLNLVVSARSEGASSPGTAGLLYVDANGNVLGMVTLLSVPLTTNGFATLEQLATVPAGVTRVRVVLVGFAVSDVTTAGVVTFDEVGLFGN